MQLIASHNSADLLTELEPSLVKHVTSALGQQAEVKGMGKAMFKGVDGKMVGLKNKGAKTYTTRLGERILWDLHEDRDVYRNMWQILVVPMPKERQVAASISTKGEAFGSGDGANGRAKEIKSKKCNLGGTSKFGEHEESDAAAQKQHKGEENPKVAAEEEYRESMWGTIASATFSNPTSATGECDWLTLHRRMGHVALPILQQLVKNEIVAGIRVKGEPDEVLGCPTCMQAKFTRYPFSSSEATAKAPLDEVVMDVCDVAETVKTDWLPMVERQQNRLVKAIRTDRGGEFLSKEFSLWLEKNGIRYSLTMPYSPAMNGIAERANRTIMETARGLLIEAGLLDYFWRDAVRSGCVAKNRVLTHVGAHKWVPNVEWIGRKPKVDMLWVFECMCMAFVPMHLRQNKLGAKAIWAVHLGMAQNSKGWLLWDPFTKKVLVSRDCKFMENLMYKDWKAENEANIGMRFGEVKSSGLEHVELPYEMSNSSTTTRKSSLVNGGEEAKDAEEEEEEVQQNLHIPAAEEEGRGKRRIQAPNRLTYEALGKRAKSALAGAALIVGDDEESDYEECAFAFFSPVEMLGEPATLKEVLESSDAEEWKKAMESELKSIEENGTWELVELPEGRNVITSKWLFKIKSDADGKIERYKSRLVAKGYQQKEKWYLKLRGVLEEIGFTPSTVDHSLFMLGEGEQRIFMVVYVDEILIFSPSSDLVKEVMLKLHDKFKCKALGDVNFYFGFHIERDVEKRCMRVHQRKYLEALAANFGQSEGHVATPFPSGLKCLKGLEEKSVGEEERRRFHSLVGSLMYAAVNTRPDVAFTTGQLARVFQCPNEKQVAAGMRVAKYLGQTATVGLQYSAAVQRRQKGADGVEPGCLFLTAFSDASYASEPEDMTSVGGFICCVAGGPTAWERKKQLHQALSSVESEYMALFRAVREIVWQRRLLAELGEEQQGPSPLYCDSQGVIALAKNPVLHGLTKHMRVKWHWTRSMVAAGEVELRYVTTTGQPADMMTKRLVEQQHWKPPPALGPAPSGVSQVDPLPGIAPIEVAVDSGASPGAASGGAEPGGAGSEGAGSGRAEPRGEEPRGAEPAGVEPWGAESEGAESGGAEPRGAASSGDPAGASQRLSLQQLREWLVRRARLQRGALEAGGTGDAGVRGAGVTARAGGTGGTVAAGPGGARTRGAGAAGTGGVGGAGPKDPTEPGAAGARDSCAGTGVGGAGAVGAGAVDPGAGGARGTPASPLPAPSPYTEQSGGLTERRECALGTDVLEDKQEDFECLAVDVPRSAPMLLTLEGDPDAPDIPTPRSYAEAITGTYVDEVPPPGVNIVNVEYFQTFSPTPKMTTLRVLLHVVAQRDYELHSLDFSTAFLLGNLHEEIWLQRSPGFTKSSPAGTHWSLRWPVYSLRQAPREWHDTLRTTLSALGFAPSTADSSLFLRTGTSLPPFYVLIYDDDLVFATADTETLTLVKSELQKRYTCTDQGELRSYLGLQITLDRARHTITLTQSHMVHQVLQRFSFQFSSPQPTPLSTSHSLSAPPSNESVEPSGPYLELVGCLMYLMTCIRPDLAYPLGLLARYMAPCRHRKSRLLQQVQLLPQQVRVEQESRPQQQVQLRPQQARVEQESWPQQQVLLQPQKERVEEEPQEQQRGQVPRQQSPEEAERQQLRDLLDTTPARFVSGPLPSPPVPLVESLSSSQLTRRSPLNRVVSPEPRRSRYRADGPFHLVLCSRVTSPPVFPQPPESSLTVFHDPLSDYLRPSRPIISRVLSALVTHPTAPPQSVSALVITGPAVEAAAGGATEPAATAAAAATSTAVASGAAATGAAAATAAAAAVATSKWHASIAQSFTLPASPQQNGIAELRIGLVIEVARTSMIHAVAPHFPWSFAVRYAAHHLNLWARVSVPETLPTLRWTGEVGDASAFRVSGALSHVRNTTAGKLSPRTLRCIFLGFPTDAPPWQFYHPASRRILSSQDVTFDELACFYRLHPHVSSPLSPPPLFLVPGPPPVDPLPPQAPAPSGLSQVDPTPLVEPLEVFSNTSGPAKGGDPAADDMATTRRSPRLETPPGFPPRPTLPPPKPVTVDSGAAGGGDTEGADFGGAGPWVAESRDAGSGGANSGGAGSGGVDTRAATIPRGCGNTGAGGPGVAGGKGARTAGAKGARAGGVGGTEAAGAGGPGAGGTRGARAAGAGGARAGGAGGTGAAVSGGARAGDAGGNGAAGGRSGRAGGAGGTGAARARGAGAGGTGGAGVAGAGGARGAGAGGARAGGAGGTGAAGPGGARAGGAGGTGVAGARGTGAGGFGGARARGAGGTGAAGTGSARAGGTGGAGAGGTKGTEARGAGGARAADGMGTALR
ncbi:unnamed protein product [Closterium sp. NIES-54]